MEQMWLEYWCDLERTRREHSEVESPHRVTVVVFYNAFMGACCNIISKFRDRLYPWRRAVGPGSPGFVSLCGECAEVPSRITSPRSTVILFSVVINIVLETLGLERTLLYVSQAVAVHFLSDFVRHLGQHVYSKLRLTVVLTLVGVTTLEVWAVGSPLPCVHKPQRSTFSSTLSKPVFTRSSRWPVLLIVISSLPERNRKKESLGLSPS